MQDSPMKDTKAWWQYGHVWLIISGPAIVVVAGFVTLYLAMTSPNEMVNDETYRQSIERGQKQGQTVLQGGGAPALQARNHAATGEVPIPK